MLTTILASISSFASGLLSGFGLHIAAGSLGAGEAIVAGTGVLIFSKYLGKLLSKIIRLFLIFLIGMLIYRHVPEFKLLVDTICGYIDTYLPSLISDFKTMINQ